MTVTSPHPVFQIQRIYLKELSLEQPNSPAIFLDPEVASVDVAIDVDSVELAAAIYEASITLTVTGKIRDQTAFLVEAKQAGIFEIRDIAPDQLGALLGIGCPSILYPYLRANIADILTRGGFPPVHLAEMNFEAFYRQRQQHALKERQSAVA